MFFIINDPGRATDVSEIILRTYQVALMWMSLLSLIIRYSKLWGGLVWLFFHDPGEFEFFPLVRSVARFCLTPSCCDFEGQYTEHSLVKRIPEPLHLGHFHFDSVAIWNRTSQEDNELKFDFWKSNRLLCFLNHVINGEFSPSVNYPYLLRQC